MKSGWNKDEERLKNDNNRWRTEKVGSIWRTKEQGKKLQEDKRKKQRVGETKLKPLRLEMESGEDSTGQKACDYNNKEAVNPGC